MIESPMIEERQIDSSYTDSHGRELRFRGGRLVTVDAYDPVVRYGDPVGWSYRVWTLDGEAITEDEAQAVVEEMRAEYHRTTT